MDRKTIDKILYSGTVKDKIILYFNDLAIQNAGYDFNENLVALTDEEKAQISSEIKTSKDKKYYNSLVLYSKSYLIFKPNMALCLSNMSKIETEIRLKFLTYTFVKLSEEIKENVLNNILNENEKNKVKKEIELIINKSIPETVKESLKEHINIFNKWAEEQKIIISGLDIFTKKHLPLPYLKSQIKNQIKLSKEIIKNLKDLLPDENINSWEDIEVEITAEDIQDIKNAGL